MGCGGEGTLRGQVEDVLGRGEEGSPWESAARTRIAKASFIMVYGPFAIRTTSISRLKSSLNVYTVFDYSPAVSGRRRRLVFMLDCRSAQSQGLGNLLSSPSGAQSISSCTLSEQGDSMSCTGVRAISKSGGVL